MDDWASQYKNGDQFEKWHTNFKNGARQWKIGTPKYKNGANTSRTNTKLPQAIFLPVAWGKIPVFMGKNHPTPRAAMAFFIPKTTP